VLVLGLLVVIVAIAAGVLLFLATQSLTTPVNLDAAGISVGMTPLALIIAGAVVLLLLWLGLALLRGSARRRARPRREAKEAQRQAEFEENIRADERNRAEETHQQAIAERDRVREQEFESRLAERDRAREEEYASRRSEDESRIRADERARVERELEDRHSAAVAAGGGALAGAAAEGVAHRHDRTPDGLGDRGATEAADRDGLGTDAAGSAGAAPDHDRALDDSANERRAEATDLPATWDDGAGSSRNGVEGNGTTTNDADDEVDDTASDAEPGRHRHRTVADKIMGRTGRDDSTS
jgi:membrane protein implicated in regulation of membrane protease activity